MTIIGITADVETLEEFLHWKTMLAGIVECGAVPLVLDRQQPGGVHRWLQRIDGLILSGGGDVAPHRYGRMDTRGLVEGVSVTRDNVEESLYWGALAAGMPVLAICRGLQLVNVIHGGTLAVDVTDLGYDRPLHQPGLEKLPQPAHTATVDDGSALGTVLQGLATTEFAVNSQHHQVVDRLGTGLTITGRAADGSVESLELVDGQVARMLAVQWHPEVDWPTNAQSQRLLQRFTDSARNVERQRHSDSGTGWTL